MILLKRMFDLQPAEDALRFLMQALRENT